MGHEIDKDGLRPTSDKLEAIRKAPTPSNVTELKAFLGLLNFYSRFLPNTATVLEPLYKLLKKNVHWQWSADCESSFQKAKDLLENSQVLALYDCTKPLKLTCDASSYGLGVVLSQYDGQIDRPIGFASRTLSSAERNYAHIEREGLAIIFGVRKYHKYLYGRHFEIVTDHQPLMQIFNPKRHTNQVAAARIQRWINLLMGYDYEINYKKGRELSNADCLSRLPLPENEIREEFVDYFSPLAEIPFTAHEVEQETRNDPVLSKVYDMVMCGWPQRVDEEYKAYFVRRYELSTDQGCILWNNRVIIPSSLRHAVLTLLHEEHPGINRVKMLARSWVWWPKMDDDLESLVKKCSVCQSVQKSAECVPLQPWPLASNIWERVHMDFADVEGTSLLIMVDTYSKWVEVKVMTSTTASHTVEAVRTCFAAYGLPVEAVTDNGPQFRSNEFKTFLSENGVRHVCSPPYHPQSNGAVERVVQSVKKGLLKARCEDEAKGRKRSLQHQIDNFLFAYRATPHTFTEKSPSEIFLRRHVRTRLSMLKPNSLKKFEEKTAHNKVKADQRRGKARMFVCGQDVYVKSVRNEKINWWPGKVIKVISAVTYLVKVGDRVRFCHADHLRLRGDEQCFWPDFDEPAQEQQTHVNTPVVPEAVVCPELPLRRSSRIRKQPERLQYV